MVVWKGLLTGVAVAAAWATLGYLFESVFEANSVHIFIAAAAGAMMALLAEYYAPNPKDTERLVPPIPPSGTDASSPAQ